MNHTAPGALRRRLIAAGSLAAAAALAFTGCASGGSGAGSDANGGDDTIGVSLIVKTTTNPFFVAMQDGAEAAADDLGVELTIAAGKEDGDEDTQIQAIENAISKGDAGILITPNGPAVEDALVKARDAGLYVIALDTPPADPDVGRHHVRDRQLPGRPGDRRVDRREARRREGHDRAASTCSTTRSSRSTTTATRASSTAWASTSPTPRPTATRRRPARYSGGDYEIVGNEASQGAEDGGRTAAETLLSKNPDINVVYTINEPAAYGAYEAFKAAGKRPTTSSSSRSTAAAPASTR